jgi:hypothetical protein
MRRVWGIDVLECDRCQGRMKVIAAITQAAAIAKSMPAEPPPIATARAPPVQLDWVC